VYLVNREHFPGPSVEEAVVQVLKCLGCPGWLINSGAYGRKEGMIHVVVRNDRKQGKLGTIVS